MLQIFAILKSVNWLCNDFHAYIHLNSAYISQHKTKYSCSAKPPERIDLSSLLMSKSHSITLAKYYTLHSIAPFTFQKECTTRNN